MLLGLNPDSVYLAASLIGFLAGTAISFLLLVLTLRARRLPGTRMANLLFTVCCLTWNLAGFAHAIVTTLGIPDPGRSVRTFLAFQFSAAAAWPIPVLALWSPLASHPRQKNALRLLRSLAVLSCAIIVAVLWYGVFNALNQKTVISLKESTAYNGAILLLLAIALFRDRLLSRPMRIPSLAILTGVFGATLADVSQQVLPFDPVVCNVLRSISEQLTLFIVLGAFFLFARFRFSDLFIRNSVRLMLAALVAAAFLVFDRAASSLGFERRAAFPAAARFFVEALAVAVTLFLFRFVDRHIRDCVDRWLFHAPDTRAVLRQLSETLAHLGEDSRIAEAAETVAQKALDLRTVKLVRADKLPLSGRVDAIADGEMVEVDGQYSSLSWAGLADVELLVPVRTDGQVHHVLAVAPGQGRRGLVTHEVNFLRNVATQIGGRIDALRVEERNAEARSKEAVLQQQVTEAELRALRAQINPHFLFNSLNSIANLVVTDPEKAETMTLRLARVFRHVLANSARPLIALHEEIAFLETYLQIEEARFGNRLRVEISVDPAVEMDPIPSLILQPIVENALKHGLAPKPGAGHLWITADTDGARLRLRVEDDGVGTVDTAVMSGAEKAQSTGVGLENVAMRLNAIYRDESRITLESRKTGGTRVTIVLPRESPLPA